MTKTKNKFRKNQLVAAKVHQTAGCGDISLHVGQCLKIANPNVDRWDEVAIFTNKRHARNGYAQDVQVHKLREATPAEKKTWA